MKRFILKEIDGGFELSNSFGSNLCNYNVKGPCFGYYVIEKQSYLGGSNLLNILQTSKKQAFESAHTLALNDIQKSFKTLDNLEDKTSYSALGQIPKPEQTTKLEPQYDAYYNSGNW